jgi:hypothetical protein
MTTMCQRRRGFTLLEVTLVSGLTVFLAVLLSSTWALLSRPTAELIAWGQIFQEMDLAVASLARDLGGSLSDYQDASGQPGGKQQGALVECRQSSDINGDHLQLCFDGGDSPNGQADWNPPTSDTIVDYYVCSDSHTLVRWNQTTGTFFKAAKNVDQLQVVDNGDNFQITLRFRYVPEHGTRALVRSCTLTAKKKP